MKKLLTVLIALSLVASGFAAEPLADVNTVDFSGEASVTWGIDVDSQQTGFENATDVELIIQLLPGDMTKSTEGSGVWGELVLLVDGDTNLTSEDAGNPVALDAAEVIVDAAKIHINDLYVGITSGDFDYDGDILFPNALNYDGDDAGYNMVNNGNEITGFNQGIVVGYANDMFNVEAAIRSNQSVSTDAAHIVGVTIVEGDGGPFDDASELIVYYRVSNEEKLDTGDNADNEVNYYRVVYENDGSTFWTDQYAIGGYAEFTGIENLRVGLGGSYVLTGEDVIDPTTTYNKGDHQIFAGADYVFMLNDSNSIVPAVAYNYNMDMNPITEKGSIRENNLGLGLAYRWGDSVDADSLLADFYEGDLVYTLNDEDTNLLPGVSVWTNLSFLANDYPNPAGTGNDLDGDDKDDIKNSKDIDSYLPIMVNAYTGEIVPGLKAYGLFYMNIAPNASLYGITDVAGLENDPDWEIISQGEPVQIGLAASYDIAVGDVTITPKAGALVNYSKLSTEGVTFTDPDAEKYRNDTTITATTFRPEVAVDVAGLIPNTTFSAAWADASYTSGKNVSNEWISPTENEVTTVEEKSSTNGEVTFKVTIAL